MIQLLFPTHINKNAQRILLCGIVLFVSFFNTSSNAQTKDTTYAPTDTANIYFNDSSVRTSTSKDSYTDSVSTTIAPPTERVEEDTTAPSDKKIYAAGVSLSEDSVNKIRKSKDFGYMVYLDSLLKAQEIAKNQHPLPPPESGISFWDAPIIRLLCWATAIGMVGFVLYKIFLGQGSAFSSNTKNNIPVVYLDAELDENDLEGQLKRAIEQGNYRLATRYLFLKTLQQLSHKNVISLSTEKTNLQYANELKSKTYAESFARLCFLYEYVWFGEFNINEAQFQSIQQQQQQLAKAI